MTKKVLAIGMYDSVHFARWLAQFQDQHIDFLLFPSSPHRRLHPKLLELLTNKSSANYSLAPLSRLYGLPLWMADKIFANRIRASLLKLTIGKFRPDYVHALELQNAGYVAAQALRSSKPGGLKLIVTNYGSDIFWFRRFAKHLAKIKQLLSLADFYACECERDVELARELGFKGEVMPVRPNAGGFAEEVLSQPLRPISERQVIAIKGYHGWVGRAHVAIEAIGQISESLKQYEIVFYSCNRSTIRLAKNCASKTGLRITTHPKGHLSHIQMLELFGRAAVYVGLSESDGISTSLLEAMAMGAVPVQTSSACCDEWFNSKTGIGIKSIDAASVADGITRALELAREGKAAETNRQTIKAKASEEYVRQAALTFYR